MQKANRTFLNLLAVALMVGAMPVLAQQTARPPADPQQPARPPADSQLPAKPPAESLRAQGELLKVDATAKTLSIKVSPDSQMVFRYSDDTKVKGADKGVAGLATMTGAQVIVHYTKQDKDNVATEIEIQQNKQG